MASSVTPSALRPGWWWQRTSTWERTLYSKLWGLLLLSGSLIRLWRLGAAPLWYDERLEAWVVSLPFRQMLEAVGADVHPPLHYVILWALTQAGLASAFWLRLPSVVAGVAAIWLTRQLAARWLSERAGLLAGLFVTFAPFQLNYSQEARSYALLQALILWGLLSISAARWTQTTLALMLLPYAHNYGLVYVAVLAPLAAGRLWGWLEDQHQANQRNWLAALGGVLLPTIGAYLPWSTMLAGQVAEQHTGWWKTASTLGQVLYVYYNLLWHTTLPGAWAVWAAAVQGGLLAAAVLSAPRLRSGFVLLYLAAAPVIAALVIELVYRPLLLHRAMIGAAVPMYLLIAHALDVMPYRRLALVMAAPLLAVGALAAGPMREMQNAGQLWVGPDAYAYIAAHAQPGDMVLHGNPATLVDAWGRLDLPQALMPIQPGSLGVPSARFWRLLAVPITATPGAERVWVVWSAGPSIAAAEDAAVRALTADAETIWTGHTDVADAGLWLLSR